MRKVIAVLFALIIGITLNAQQVSNIADSNNLFAFKLYNEVKENGKRNRFFSPFSIYTALAMTYTGARNKTEKQMRQTLHFSLDQNAFQQNYKSYLEKIGSDTGKDLTIGIANSLWIANSFKLLAPFSDIVTSNYHSEAKNVDFSNSEQVREQINLWVENKTNNKIKNLIKPNILDADTRLVLVNAIYFKGKWATPFSKDSTKADTFYEFGWPIKSKFMHNTAHYSYYEDTTLQAIEIPYSGGKTSMVVFLPKDKNGSTSMEKKLNYSYYSKVISLLGSQKAIVSLPKFKTTDALQIAEILSDMGMPVAFSHDADFSGISHESLYINKIIHKAFIDVNEEGTEAAAATAVVMKQMTMRPTPIRVFNANHPFVFVIRDIMTGGILFMGEIIHPAIE